MQKNMLDYMLLIKKNLQTKEEIVRYILDNYSAKQLVEELAERIMNEPKTTKITLSQEEYDTVVNLFRVRGVTSDGTAETRGRKKREEKIED